MKEIIDSATLNPCEVYTFPEPSPRITQEKRCYSVDDVCAILGVSRNYVYALLKHRVFRWFRLGATGRYRISKTDFDAWLESKV